MPLEKITDYKQSVANFMNQNKTKEKKKTDYYKSDPPVWEFLVVIVLIILFLFVLVYPN